MTLVQYYSTLGTSQCCVNVCHNQPIVAPCHIYQKNKLTTSHHDPDAESRIKVAARIAAETLRCCSHYWPTFDATAGDQTDRLLAPPRTPTRTSTAPFAQPYFAHHPSPPLLPPLLPPPPTAPPEL